MIDFFSRLDKFMNYKGLNDNKITVETSISNGLIGKGRKRGALSQDSISKILHTYPELDANWLFTGRGSMLIKDEKDELENIDKEEDRELIRELIEKNGELRQQLGEQINENTHLHGKNMQLQAEIDELKKKEQNKSTQRHSVCSGTDIAAESQERLK